jgi:aryl-alcohol dehydrogenase-like predicted oxidoreductase
MAIKKIKVAELELSQLMLGTVQFGLSYGIANKVGQPSYETVRNIITCAFEGGVNCFDTAPLYGTSEEILGKVLRELQIVNKVTVVTKVAHMADDYSSLRVVDQVVEESVVTSLKRLHLEILPICIFHKESDFRYVDSLLKLKDKGLVRHIGSSVMTPKATGEIISSGLAQALQIPTNILDHRFSHSGITAEAKKRGVALFVRSIYLQGLILLPEEEILPELEEVKPVLRKIRGLAAEAGMSASELAARYVLGLEGLTCAVVGLETVEQMQQNIELFSKGPLDPDLMQAAVKAVPDLSDIILMPNKWSKRMPDAKPQSR